MRNATAQVAAVAADRSGQVVTGEPYGGEMLQRQRDDHGFLGRESVDQEVLAAGDAGEPRGAGSFRS